MDFANKHQRAAKTEERAASDRERHVQARFAHGHSEQRRAVRDALGGGVLLYGTGK